MQHHFRDQDSYHALKITPPWTWGVCLVTLALIAAAGIFVWGAEIDSWVPVEGFVRKDELEYVLKPADDAVYLVASLQGKAVAAARVGEMARIALRGGQTGQPRFVQARITRLTPWPMAQQDQVAGTPSSDGVRLALTLVPPVPGVLANLPPNVDLPVTLQLSLRQHRDIDFSSGPALK